VHYQHLKFSVRDGIALITLDRPENMNAFTPHMLESWFDAITNCEQSDEIRVVILTGAGRAFCAGGDIKDFLSQDLKAWDLKNFLQEKVHRVALAMDELNKPTIAALNGPARGAGMDMALFCDIRIASERASLSESYIKLGMAPGDGGAFSLPRIVGPAKAMEWFLTGNPIEVDEALRFGLVNKVVPHDRLMEEAYLMARTIADHSPPAVRMTKRAVKQALSSNLRDHLEYISSQMGLMCETEQFREAVRRFLARSRVSEEEAP
jgi:enoyl-CoA hydratase/carnithine racemase